MIFNKFLKGLMDEVFLRLCFAVFECFFNKIIFKYNICSHETPPYTQSYTHYDLFSQLFLNIMRYQTEYILEPNRRLPIGFKKEKSLRPQRLRGCFLFSPQSRRERRGETEK